MFQEIHTMKYITNVQHFHNVLLILNVSQKVWYDGLRNEGLVWETKIMDDLLDRHALYYQLSEHVIPLNTLSYRFLTCYSIPELSFQFYLKPFPPGCLGFNRHFDSCSGSISKTSPNPG